jgi:ligand-binding sensor domain-containing protein
VKLDKTTEEMTFYNSANSGLPHNEVYALARDGSDNIWMGTWGGLAKFDGSNWTVYNTSNSGLPHNAVRALAIGGSNIWMGTYYGGVAKFDGTNWTVYNTSNSGLPDNLILSLAIDGSNIWIGTWGGLAKFDGTNWTVYNTSNSGLPDNWVFAIAIDGSDNKWIGTWLGGVAVYREGGVILNIEQESRSTKIPSAFSLSQNYPNPFNPTTKIKYQIPEKNFVTLKVYDVLGSEIATLVNEEKSIGTYEITWTVERLPSGIYFYRLQAVPTGRQAGSPSTGSGQSFVETKKMVLLR